MVAVAEDRGARIRRVAALALEHAGAVVQAVRQYVNRGVLPGNELSVVPDEVDLFHDCSFVSRGATAGAVSLTTPAGPPGGPRRCPPSRPGHASAGHRPARRQPLILSPRPPFPGQTRGAASARRTAASRA